jgi:hypothetical protein
MSNIVRSVINTPYTQGFGMVNPRSTNDLRYLKNIVAGDNIELSGDADTVVITASSTIGSGVNTVQNDNTSTGQSIISTASTLSDVKLKTLIGLGNQINQVGGGDLQIENLVTVTDAVSITGQSLKSGLSTTYNTRLKGIKSNIGSDLTVSTIGQDLVITSTPYQFNQAPGGSGESIKSTLSTSNNFLTKSIIGTGTISTFTSGQDLYIQNSVWNPYNIIYIDSNSGGPIEDGSYNGPWRTLESAVNFLNGQGKGFYMFVFNRGEYNLPFTWDYPMYDGFSGINLSMKSMINGDVKITSDINFVGLSGFSSKFSIDSISLLGNVNFDFSAQSSELNNCIFNNIYINFMQFTGINDLTNLSKIEFYNSDMKDINIITNGINLYNSNLIGNINLLNAESRILINECISNNCIITLTSGAISNIRGLISTNNTNWLVSGDSNLNIFNMDPLSSSQSILSGDLTLSKIVVDKKLVAGTNITLTDDGQGQTIIDASGGGGGGDLDSLSDAYNNTNSQNTIALGFKPPVPSDFVNNVFVCNNQFPTMNYQANQNVCVGNSSLLDITNATYTTVCGNGALSSFSQGIHNTSLGFSSGLGAGAGNVNSSYCTYLGSDTSTSLATVQRSTALGYGAVISSDDGIFLPITITQLSTGNKFIMGFDYTTGKMSPLEILGEAPQFVLTTDGNGGYSWSSGTPTIDLNSLTDCYKDTINTIYIVGAGPPSQTPGSNLTILGPHNSTISEASAYSNTILGTNYVNYSTANRCNIVGSNNMTFLRESEKTICIGDTNDYSVSDAGKNTTNNIIIGNSNTLNPNFTDMWVMGNNITAPNISNSWCVNTRADVVTPNKLYVNNSTTGQLGPMADAVGYLYNNGTSLAYQAVSAPAWSIPMASAGLSTQVLNSGASLSSYPMTWTVDKNQGYFTVGNNPNLTVTIAGIYEITTNFNYVVNNNVAVTQNFISGYSVNNVGVYSQQQIISTGVESTGCVVNSYIAPLTAGNQLRFSVGNNIQNGIQLQIVWGRMTVKWLGVL